jgi:hypothetical protein
MQDLKEVQKKIYPPMVDGDYSFSQVTDKISDVTLKKYTPFKWYVGFALAFMVAQLLLMTVVYLVSTGIGIWGNNQPIGWAFDIINFVWWIGIGHAGTLISAVLLLMNQKWRTSINRFAEAMTLFAVACAGMFPYGAAVACLLAFAISECNGHVDQFPKPVNVGRFRRFYLCNRFAFILVCRFNPRFRNPSG